MNKKNAIDTFTASKKKEAPAIQGTPEEAAKSAQKRMKCVRVFFETARQMRQLGADLMRSDQELMHEAINLLFKQHGYKPIA